MRVSLPRRTLSSPALAAAVDRWFLLDKGTDTQKEAAELVTMLAEEELEMIFLRRLTFGTAGLRGLMGAGFNRMNDVTLQQTSQGYCAFLLDRFGSDGVERGVVIGFDARYNSKNFAELTAAVFLSKAVKVYLWHDYVHTPLIAYTVTKLNCMGGVMITASHNPKDYNGYKVYGEDGAQILPPMDTEITNWIASNLSYWPVVENYFDRKSRSLSATARQSANLVRNLDPTASLYFKDLASDLSAGKPVSSDVKFVYTAMHGVGSPMICRMLEAFGYTKNIIYVEKQCLPDPEFPTVEYPNPEEPGALQMAMETADARGATVVLANDPDADRFAAAEKYDGKWYQFTGDELGIMFAAYAMELREKQGWKKDEMALICSAVSSRMLEKLARENGILFAETLTGFKWMENKAIELESRGFKTVLSYEEALGYALSQHVRDKDGVSALAVFVDMASDLYSRGKTINECLTDLRRKYGFFTTCNSYFVSERPNELKACFEEFAAKKNYPTSLGEFEIIRVRDVGAGYDSAAIDMKCSLPTCTEMVTFYLDNGAMITLRRSGTEPKLKYYAEVCAHSEEEGHRQLKRVIKALVENFLKPRKHLFPYLPEFDE